MIFLKIHLKKPEILVRIITHAFLWTDFIIMPHVTNRYIYHIVMVTLSHILFILTQGTVCRFCGVEAARIACEPRNEI